MKRNMIKLSGIALMAALVTAMMLVIFTESASAAMGDLDPAGSRAISPNAPQVVAENVETKFNFGTDYNYDYYYYKITPSKTGYIVFKNDYTRANYVALCNESKQVVSAEDPTTGDFLSYTSTYPYQTFISYGVKKGKTYLIRVKGGSQNRIEYKKPFIGTVKWENKAYKAMACGTSKKRAKAIKYKKTVKGLFVAGSKKAQWFKFKAKKRNTKVYLASKYNNGYIKADVIYGSKSWQKGRLSVMRHDDFQKDSGKLTVTKGKTCYIKVYPDKKTSGAYTIKIK